MTESTSHLSAPARSRAADRARQERRQRLIAIAVGLFVLGNGVGVVYLWGTGGEAGLNFSNSANIFQEIGRITALLAGYIALIEVILLARLPFVERIFGFDRLTIWHRWNGHAVIYLVLAHVVFTVWGYADVDGKSWFQEYWNWLTLPQPGSSSGSVGAVTTGKHLCLSLSCAATTTSPYPGIITATVGTFLLVVVFVTSLVIVKRKLSYEWWYAIHFTAYAGIALAWFHMIPDGNDLHVIIWAQDYWKAIFAFALAVVVFYRLLRPIWRWWRFGMRVTEVVEEGPGVWSLRIGGRNLDKLGVKAGQFFFFRFLTRGFWYTALPFSLSESPDGKSLRITVKNLGDHTARMGSIPVGTRVFAEGPFGVFTVDSRTEDKALLVAGGIGITPVRALLEDMGGDVVVLYRVVSADDLIFSTELERIAAQKNDRVDYVVGDHATPEGRELMSPHHLRQLVPDIAERDVYICGPVGMVDSVIPNLRAAGVAHHHLHVERFAL